MLPLRMIPTRFLSREPSSMILDPVFKLSVYPVLHSVIHYMVYLVKNGRDREDDCSKEANIVDC